MNHGTKQSGDCFCVYVTVPRQDKKPGFFVTNISKKNVRDSVDRNRYKRWIRAVYHANKPAASGINLLVMPRHGMAKLHSYAEIESVLLPQMKQAVKKQASGK